MIFQQVRTQRAAAEWESSIIATFLLFSCCCNGRSRMNMQNNSSYKVWWPWPLLTSTSSLGTGSTVPIYGMIWMYYILIQVRCGCNTYFLYRVSPYPCIVRLFVVLVNPCWLMVYIVHLSSIFFVVLVNPCWFMVYIVHLSSIFFVVLVNHCRLMVYIVHLSSIFFVVLVNPCWLMVYIVHLSSIFFVVVVNPCWLMIYIVHLIYLVYFCGA